jgi:hypothetical protein
MAFEVDMAIYELVPPDGVLVAIFAHDNTLSPADMDLRAIREYLGIPGVARILVPWVYWTPWTDGECKKLLRLAEFVQPHFIYGVGDEQNACRCVGYVLPRNYQSPTRKLQVLEDYERFQVEEQSAQQRRWKARGAAARKADTERDLYLHRERRTARGARGAIDVPHLRSLWRADRIAAHAAAASGSPRRVFIPSVTQHYTTHGSNASHHSPFFHSADTFPRPMRKRSRESASGVRFNGWPLPLGRPELTPSQDHPTREISYEAKVFPNDAIFSGVASFPATAVVRANRSHLFASVKLEWLESTRRAVSALAAATTATAKAQALASYWEFPPRNVWPFAPPPIDRPRRYVWAMMGQLRYGDRAAAVDNFTAALGVGGFPYRVNDHDTTLANPRGAGGLSRWEVMQRVLSDAIFAPIGGGEITFETARPYDAARCGAIPVIAGDPSKVDRAYRTLLGFEGQYPDGWIVATTWKEAAALAKQALETPGEVLRLRRLVMHGYERMRNALHAHVRRGLLFARSIDPQSFWDEDFADLVLAVPQIPS